MKMTFRMDWFMIIWGALIILKALELTKIAWIYILIPLWIPVGIIALALSICIIAAIIALICGGAILFVDWWSNR